MKPGDMERPASNKKTQVNLYLSLFINNAEDGAHKVRWTLVLCRPKRSEDLETWGQGTLRF